MRRVPASLDSSGAASLGSANIVPSCSLASIRLSVLTHAKPSKLLFSRVPFERRQERMRTASLIDRISACGHGHHGRSRQIAADHGGWREGVTESNQRIYFRKAPGKDPSVIHWVRERTAQTP